MHVLADRLRQPTVPGTRPPPAVPDLDASPPERVRSWLLAAKSLGEDVTMTYPEGHCINVVLDTDIVAPQGELGIITPMTVRIGDQVIDLGTIEL